MTRARNEQKAVVDLLKGDLSRIRKRIGAADYQKIDAHLEGVLAMERRILPPPTTPTTVGCTIPPSPDDGHQQQRELPDPGHADDGRRGAHPGVRRDARPDAAAQPRLQRHHAHLARAHERRTTRCLTTAWIGAPS